MKKLLIVLTFLLCSMFHLPAFAAETRQLVFAVAMENSEVQETLIPGIDLYFVGDDYPKVEREFAVSKASRTVNGFLKNKYKTCEMALASALVDIQRAALNYGGEAIIDITSTLNNKGSSSVEKYDCLVGITTVTVEVKGTIVKFGSE